MIRTLIPLFALFFIAPLQAEPRTWKSADASTSFVGEYISHDGQRVTIRRSDDRVFTLELEKIHQSDRDWLALKALPTKSDVEPDANPNAVFDTLCFGDSREQVKAKLLASKLVSSTIDDTFFGRFGLNGTFRTNKQIGGLTCELFFDWSKGGNLKEVSLQTQPLGSAAFPERIRTNWAELAKLLSILHGNPLQAADFPASSDLQNDLFLGSHLWRLEGGGTAMLGIAMEADQYMVVVRFTTESIKPVPKP